MNYVSCSCVEGNNFGVWGDSCTVPPFSAGLQFGASIFEGIQALVFDNGKKNKVLFLEDHYQRLQYSSKVLGINVPGLQHFSEGVHRVVGETIEDNRDIDWNTWRIYLRSVHFSGVEAIFPSSDYPFFCNIMATPIKKPNIPTYLHLLTDKTFVRALSGGSKVGKAKSAINYTRIIEIDQSSPITSDTQRLWLSPTSEETIEEMDTMSIGFVMQDGRLCTPPPSSSKLSSITMKRLKRRMAEYGRPIDELSFSFSDFCKRIEDGQISGIFGASTGKGIGIAQSIKINESKRTLEMPAEVGDLLCNAYQSILEDNDEALSICTDLSQ